MKSFFMIKLLIYMASLYRGVQINLGKGLALCLLGVVCIVSVMCKVINVKTDGSSIFFNRVECRTIECQLPLKKREALWLFEGLML